MLTRLKRFVYALLWDEEASQRYLAVFFYLLGDILTSGGVVPGTGTVLPGLQWLFPLGPYCKAVAFYMGAGGQLPAAVRMLPGGR